MKFLLTAINAKYIHSNPAIYSLRAYAGEEMRPHIALAEYTVNQRMSDILADIYEQKPDAVGFSCYIWNWNLIQELIRELPKILPDTDLWLGGPEVSYDAPEILRDFPQIKGIMSGEGEVTFRELIGWYVKGEGILDEIGGLCLPEGYTTHREPTDLSGLPFLYEEGEEGMAAFANRIVYYESSRGCPYRCSYCLSSIDKKVRLRDMEIVERELQFFLDRQVKQVKFVDRTFNCGHGHAMAVWTYLREHDNNVTNFHFEIAAEQLTGEEIALLNELRPGQVQLEIGVQSVNPRTLQAVCRVADVERLERTVAAIRRGHNIHIHLDLIAGLPYEDYASFTGSFNRVYAMGPEQLQLGFLKVLKGSPMALQAAEYGIRYLGGPPYEVLSTKWLSYEEVRRLKRVEEMVELYYNSGQFTHTLSFLERVFVHPFAMFEALADYYREKGYLTESPARAYRYQVLLEFALTRDEARAGVYKELLTYDMYLRENVKSRPDFAADLDSEEKEFIRNFYKREERERTFLPAYEEYDWKQLGRMTHLEPFRYTVWELPGVNICESDVPHYVLFDYRLRNPLNAQAAIQVIVDNGGQDRTKQDGTKQDGAKQDGAKQDEAKQDEAKQDEERQAVKR